MNSDFYDNLDNDEIMKKIKDIVKSGKYDDLLNMNDNREVVKNETEKIKNDIEKNNINKPIDDFYNKDSDKELDVIYDWFQNLRKIECDNEIGYRIIENKVSKEKWDIHKFEQAVDVYIEIGYINKVFQDYGYKLIFKKKSSE